MTREQALNYLVSTGLTEEQVMEVVEALEQEPCDVPGINVGDMISRQAVLDLANKGVLISNGNYKSVCKAINEIPPVNPQPKTGHWIPTYGNVKCSVCGSVKDSREVGKATHYCDFCGAKMVEPQESEEV